MGESAYTIALPIAAASPARQELIELAGALIAPQGGATGRVVVLERSRARPASKGSTTARTPPCLPDHFKVEHHALSLPTAHAWEAVAAAAREVGAALAMFDWE